jgi:hypothetical protein
MAFNGSPNPNHDPLMPVTASPAMTYRNVNFKINDGDDSNTPIRNFNFGEKENTYPRFEAGIDNIATKKPVRSTTYATASAPSPATHAPVTYQVHPVTNQVHPAYVHPQVHPVYVPAPATLSHAPVHPQVHSAYTYAHPHPPVAPAVNYPPGNEPPLCQKSSPSVIQESHPYDILPSGPRATTNQDYDEAHQRGVMESSPISAYCGNPPNYPNQTAMSYASGPYTQNLIQTLTSMHLEPLKSITECILVRMLRT